MFLFIFTSVISTSVVKISTSVDNQYFTLALEV